MRQQRLHASYNYQEPGPQKAEFASNTDLEDDVGSFKVSFEGELTIVCEKLSAEQLRLLRFDVSTVYWFTELSGSYERLSDTNELSNVVENAYQFILQGFGSPRFLIGDFLVDLDAQTLTSVSQSSTRQLHREEYGPFPESVLQSIVALVSLNESTTVAEVVNTRREFTRRLQKQISGDSKQVQGQEFKRLEHLSSFEDLTDQSLDIDYGYIDESDEVIEADAKLQSTIVAGELPVPACTPLVSLQIARRAVVTFSISSVYLALFLGADSLFDAVRRKVPELTMIGFSCPKNLSTLLIDAEARSEEAADKARREIKRFLTQVYEGSRKVVLKKKWPAIVEPVLPLHVFVDWSNVKQSPGQGDFCSCFHWIYCCRSS